MKPTRVLTLALLTALLMPLQPASAQQLNPPPDPCCACLELLDIHGNVVGPLTPPAILNVAADGTATASVRIRHKGGTACPKTLSLTVGARSESPEQAEAHPTIHTFSLAPGATSAELKFEFTADHLRISPAWEIHYSCDESSNNTSSTGECKPPYHVLLNGGCESCQSCEATGDGGMNEHGDCDLSTSTFNGDIQGNLHFHPNGFQNPGTSALTPNVPPGTTVNRGPNGHITSIVTSTTLIEVKPAPAGILAQDPNAFTITHTATGQSSPFRTTTISFVTEGGVPRLRMDSTFDQSTTRHELTQSTEPAFPSFNQVGTTYHLSKGRVTSNGFEPLSRLIFSKSEPTPGKVVERRRMTERAIDSAAWFTSSDVETTLEKQIRGWVKTKEVIDPTGDALTTTWLYYQPGNITGPGGSTYGLGRLKQENRYDGRQIFHTYGLHSHTVTSPYAGIPDGKTTTTTWNPGTKTRTVTTSVGGQVISKTLTAHTPTTTTRTVHTSNGQTLATTTHYKSSGIDFGGRPVRTLHPDGTLTTHTYTRNPGGGFTVQTDNGSTTNNLTVAKGIRTTVTHDARGHTIFRSTTAIGEAGGAVMESMTVTGTEPILGRPAETLWQPAGVTTLTTYNCCGVASETDQYGIITRYAYDGLQRRIKSNRLGVTTATVRQTRQTIFNNFEPMDWQVKGTFTKTYRYPETVQADLSPELQMDDANLVSYSASNLSGTISESGSPDPSALDEEGNGVPGALAYTTTETTYAPAAGLSRRTVTTAPDDFEQTTDSFLDGRTAKTSGALSPAMVYHYSVNSTGELTTQAYLVGSEHREITGSQSDWAGRTLQSGRLASLQSSVFTSSASMHYNSKGQMVRSVDPDGVVTLMAYNAKGERTTTSIDLQPSATYNDELNNIAYGTDTIQFSETVPALSGGNPVWLTSSKVWQPGQTDPNGGTVVSTSLRSIDGLSASSTSIGVANPSTSVTVLGIDTSTGLGNGDWTTTQTNPDNTFGITTYVDGRMVSSAMFAAGADPEQDDPIAATSQAYDNLNRPTETTDSRTGTTITAYMSATNDAVKSITDPGNRTTAFTYDNRGRQIAVELPDETVTSTTYTPRGEVSGRSGSQTYPVTYTYDYAGRQKTMTTYGTEEATTTWIYSADRGFLVEKNYHGETNDGVTNADYTYTAAGRLKTRTWERGVISTYGYDAGGRLASVTYSNETNGHTTPNLAYTYDALGRIDEVTRGGVLHAKHTYRTSDLQRLAETQQIDSLNQAVTYTYEDGTNGTLQGRPNGFTFANGGATWTYDTAGRLATVSGGGLQPPGPFTYGYEPGSAHLVSTLTGPAHTVTNEWEPTRNVLEWKQNDLTGGPLSKFAYSVNSIGQRVGLTPTGSAFANNTPFVWAYNPRGELTSATRNGLTAFERAYSYDGIGNRLTATDHTAATTSYFANAAATTSGGNALNQYAKIQYPSSATIEPQHDVDGNLTSGPVPGPNGLSAGVPAPANATLTWDAENRLVEAVVGSVTIAYAYDHQSRLIAATVGSVTTRYLYDGWNRIAEYQQNGTGHEIKRSYLWGMDMSGSMQGAGGVGGLLAMTVHDTTTSTFYPTYDGNGNVSEYINLSGAKVAHFEYDPFGNLTVDSETNSAQFPYRFSTKPQDLTTGLLYYGYRYYDPVTGRWPSRDPIEEEGGINLYGFVGNDGVNMWDYMGLAVFFRSPSGNSMSGAHGSMFGVDLNPAFEAAGKKVDSRGDEFIDAYLYYTPKSNTVGDFVSDVSSALKARDEEFWGAKYSIVGGYSYSHGSIENLASSGEARPGDSSINQRRIQFDDFYVHTGNLRSYLNSLRDGNAFYWTTGACYHVPQRRHPKTGRPQVAIGDMSGDIFYSSLGLGSAVSYIRGDLERQVKRFSELREAAIVAGEEKCPRFAVIYVLGPKESSSTTNIKDQFP